MGEVLQLLALSHSLSRGFCQDAHQWLCQVHRIRHAGDAGYAKRRVITSHNGVLGKLVMHDCDLSCSDLLFVTGMRVLKVL